MFQDHMTSTSLDRAEILRLLAEIVGEVMQVPAASVWLEANLKEDLGTSSLSMVEIAAAAEDTFGINIPNAKLMGLRTVRDAVDLIEKALVSRPTGDRWR